MVKFPIFQQIKLSTAKCRKMDTLIDVRDTQIVGQGFESPKFGVRVPMFERPIADHTSDEEILGVWVVDKIVGHRRYFWDFDDLKSILLTFRLWACLLLTGVSFILSLVFFCYLGWYIALGMLMSALTVGGVYLSSLFVFKFASKILVHYIEYDHDSAAYNQEVRGMVQRSTPLSGGVDPQNGRYSNRDVLRAITYHSIVMTIPEEPVQWHFDPGNPTFIAEEVDVKTRLVAPWAVEHAMELPYRGSSTRELSKYEHRVFSWKDININTCHKTDSAELALMLNMHKARRTVYPLLVYGGTKWKPPRFVLKDFQERAEPASILTSILTATEALLV